METLKTVWDFFQNEILDMGLVEQGLISWWDAKRENGRTIPFRRRGPPQR